MIGPSLLLNEYCLRGHESNPPLRDTRASIEDGDLKNRAHNRRGPVNPPTTVREVQVADLDERAKRYVDIH